MEVICPGFKPFILVSNFCFQMGQLVPLRRARARGVVGGRRRRRRRGPRTSCESQLCPTSLKAPGDPTLEPETRYLGFKVCLQIHIRVLLHHGGIEDGSGLLEDPTMKRAGGRVGLAHHMLL